MPQIMGAAHVGLTVRDMDASAQWYQTVFGWQVVRRFGPGEAGSPRVLLFDPASLFALSVCEPEDRSADPFDHLDKLDVAHSPVRDLGRAKFVSFEDPDGIQFELWFPVVLPTGEPVPRRVTPPNRP